MQKASATAAALSFRGYGVEMIREEQKQMKRRDFLKTLFLGGALVLFRKIAAAEKQEHGLKEAMFWKRLDEMP